MSTPPAPRDDQSQPIPRDEGKAVHEFRNKNALIVGIFAALFLIAFVFLIFASQLR